MKLLTFLIAAPLFGQVAVQNLTPTLVTPTYAIVPQVLSGVTGTGPAALQFQFTAPAPGNVTSIVALQATTTAGKQLDCGPLLCLVWGMNTNPIGNGTLSEAKVTSSGSYGIGSTLGASAAGAAVPIVAGMPFAVTLSVSKCDVTRDGAVTRADADMLVSWLTGNVPVPSGRTSDINGSAVSGKGDVIDLMLVVIAALPNGTCLAD